MPALGGILSTTGVATEASPALSGTPTSTTAAVDTNTTQIATTAFVIGQAYAKLASPTFTGTPAAPTAAVDTNTTQIATTAFVIAQASAVGDGTPAMDGSAARGTSTHFARADHVHPTDTSRAPLASPALTGTPTSTTAAVDTNTTQIATTAFVLAQAASATPLVNGTAAVGTSTRYARGDHVHPTDTGRAANDLSNVSSAKIVPSGKVVMAYASGAQGNAAGWRKVVLNAEDADPDNWFDSATNNRFQPNVAGYYQISYASRVIGNGGASPSEVVVQIYKNGAGYKQATDINTNSSGVTHTGGAAIVFLNGSTDYIEIFNYTGASAAQQGSNRDTYMDAVLVAR